MQKVIILCFGVACYFVYVTCFGGNIIAHGEWRVLNVRRCPNDEQYRMTYDVRRKKINRTTDGYDMFMDLKETLDHTYGLFIDICVYVDGGCKPYQVVVDDSCERYAKTHAIENFESAMHCFGLEPSDIPVKPGNYSCNNFVFDYRELPQMGVIGKYGAYGYVMKDNERVACVDVTVDFMIKEGDHFFN